jgi:hypothetical protein
MLIEVLSSVMYIRAGAVSAGRPDFRQQRGQADATIATATRTITNPAQATKIAIAHSIGV